MLSKYYTHLTHLQGISSKLLNQKIFSFWELCQILLHVRVLHQISYYILEYCAKCFYILEYCTKHWHTFQNPSIKWRSKVDLPKNSSGLHFVSVGEVDLSFCWGWFIKAFSSLDWMLANKMRDLVARESMAYSNMPRWSQVLILRYEIFLTYSR